MSDRNIYDTWKAIIKNKLFWDEKCDLDIISLNL